MENYYDVAIIGGGAAGLGAAVALARSLRSVVVIDAGEPRNAPAGGAHNLLGREGVSPHELLATGRGEAQAYGAEIREATAVSATRGAEGFEIGLEGGERIGARKLLLATGLRDELPDIPGLRQQWGKDVLHCPYCHGWEVRGKRIGILATGPMGVHQALLFQQLSDRVTVFLQPGADLPEEGWAQLAALGVPVIDGPVSALRGAPLEAVIIDDRQEFAVDALVVAPRFTANGELYEQLGGTLTSHPMGELVPTTGMGATEIEGVWAAGNTADLKAMVSLAHGTGVEAGAAINAALVAESADAAAATRR